MTLTTTVTHLALHHLKCVDDTLVDHAGTEFDVVAYSRFKYGKASIARDYGRRLAEHFITTYPELALSDKRVVVTGPSYKYLSTAAQGIAASFSLALNAHRVSHGVEPTVSLHIIRSWVGTDTYAMVGLEERKQMLANSQHHVDELLVRDAVVIAIDDINVTGATQERMHHRLLPCNPDTIVYLHLAAMDRDEGERNAQIENVMNKTFPPTLDAIEADIQMDDFRLNSRVFRTIMETPDTESLRHFLNRRSDAFIEMMYDSLVGGTVEMYQRHPHATYLLEEVVAERNLAPSFRLATVKA